jgi:hypothetical protein
MNLKKFIIDWPWTQTTKAVFLLLAVAAVVVGLVKGAENLGNVYTFVGAGLGIGIAGMIGKRATTKVELEESQKHLDPQQPDVEFTP